MLVSSTSCKIALLVCFYVLGVCEAVADTKIVRAQIESCAGCSLKRLLQVRDFLYLDVPQYENVKWNKVQGAPPEIYFLNEADEMVEKEMLEKYNRKQCNELLVSKGFRKRDDSEKQIDEEQINEEL